MEEKGLKATLGFEVDEASIRRVAEEFTKNFAQMSTVGIGGDSFSGVSSVQNSVYDETLRIMYQQTAILQGILRSINSLGGLQSNSASSGSMMGIGGGADSFFSKGLMGAAGGAGAMLGQLALVGAGVGILIQAVEKVVEFLAESSPMLRSQLMIFQQAMNLFFMPFGNALASMMMPLMTKLLDWTISWNELVENEGLVNAMGIVFEKAILTIWDNMPPWMSEIAVALGMWYDTIRDDLAPVLKDLTEIIVSMKDTAKGVYETITGGTLKDMAEGGFDFIVDSLSGNNAFGSTLLDVMGVGGLTRTWGILSDTLSTTSSSSSGSAPSGMWDWKSAGSTGNQITVDLSNGIFMGEDDFRNRIGGIIDDAVNGAKWR